MFYGGKPIAYHQFPARQIAFSMVEEECGINCGKIQDIFIKVIGSMKTYFILMIQGFITDAYKKRYFF